MKRGELETDLSTTNTWWRRPTAGRTWEQDDRDLRGQADTGLDYEPEPLRDIQAGGLYVLVGPRRVGKSVEVKRAISATIAGGVQPLRVIHAACNTWRSRDLVTLVQLLDDLSPPVNGPRYVFLDEITAIKDDWVAQVAWLRDQTSLRDDCLVLTGSSGERIDQARRDLADRLGPATDSTRLLLPMGFRAFCRFAGPSMPTGLPTIHARDVLGADAAAAFGELRPYLADLVAAWERYLQIGGLPRAVADWRTERAVSEQFVHAIWDTIHGDALATGDWSAAQSQMLLEALSKRLSSRVNKADVRRDLGDVHHDVLDLRLKRLHDAFVTWPCHLNQGNRPDLASQSKVYFVDPLHARLAHLRRPGVRPPDFTVLTEQQLGVALLRAHEREAPGSWRDEDTLLYYRSSTDAEVDFTGRWLGRIPFEGKYTEGAWRRETQTAMAAYQHCVLATRNVLQRDDERLACPAAYLAFVLDVA